MVFKFLFTLTLIFSVNGVCNQPWETVGKPSDAVPREIQDVGITENLGAKLPLSTEFVDDKGEKVTLQKYFDGKRPVLLSLVYFECPMLCNLHLNGVADVLKKTDWTLGKEFDMVIISIDPKETPELAAKKKATYLKNLERPGAENGWHFLTGTEENIKAVAGTIGFKYKWDEPTKQWTHTAAMYAITPMGVISRYLFGIHFTEKDLKLGLLEASKGEIGNVIDRLMLFCFQYDPNQKTYAFYAYNIMKFGGGLCALVLGMFLLPHWFRMRRETKLAKGVAT